MSIDEVAAFHEVIGNDLMTRRFDFTGYLYYPFVLPGAVIAAVVALSFLRLLRRLPAWVVTGTVASGALYLSGTLGLEAISGKWASVHGVENLVYMLLTDAEELIEMLALILMYGTFERYLSLMRK